MPKKFQYVAKYALNSSFKSKYALPNCSLWVDRIGVLWKSKATFIAVNALNDCLTVGKAALQSFSGKLLRINPYKVFQV